MFNFNTRIRYSELGHDGRLSLTSLINIFQDTSNFHSAEAGMDWKYMLDRKRAWMMNYWKVFIYRRPGIGEEVRIETRPYSYDGLFGRRNFAMYDTEGNCLAMADSMWFLFDYETGHPAMNEPEYTDRFGPDEPMEMELITSRRIRLPKQMEEAGTFVVRRDVLDTNEHMNNSRYMSMAQEYIPADYEVQELHIEYKQAVKYGETVRCCTAQQDGFNYIIMYNEAGVCSAVIKYR